MHAIHPSNIKMAEQYCQYAIKLLHDNTPYDRAVFQTGVAAHYILEVLGLKANELQRELTHDEITQLIQETCQLLVTKSREYDGVPEPPIPLLNIQEAQEITMRYAHANPLPHDAFYEMPYALDKDWQPVEYNSPAAVFQTIIDMVHYYTEDDGVRVALVRDYKSSWYITGQLDNLQRKAQAMVAWMKFRPDKLILQVTSIRTGQTLSRELWVPQVEDKLNEWSDFIKMASLQLTNVDKLRAQPGPNCYQCPYTAACEFVITHANKSNHLVHKYVAALSVAKGLEKDVKHITKDNPVQQGSTIVGYTPKEVKTISKDATHLFLNAAFDAGWDIYTFLEYIKLTRSQAEKLYRDLPEKAQQELKELFITRISPRFGVHK
tara:strand:- start:4408 stop:5541 length:1134 start_codon:yes stop_codon:yes gene_type:complete